MINWVTRISTVTRYIAESVASALGWRGVTLVVAGLPMEWEGLHVATTISLDISVFLGGLVRLYSSSSSNELRSGVVCRFGTSLLFFCLSYVALA